LTGLNLLAAFREIFEARAANQISTIAVMKALIERGGDEPWAAWEARYQEGEHKGPGGKTGQLFEVVRDRPGHDSGAGWHYAQRPQIRVVQRRVFSLSPSKAPF
jgi:hypothetical protein